MEVIVDRAREAGRFAAWAGRGLVEEGRRHRVSGLAAEVAFYGILSFVPTILALAAAIGSLGTIIGEEAARQAEGEVIGFLSDVLTDDASETIDAVRDLFDSPRPDLLTVGLVLAVWGASRGFTAVIRALNLIYDVDERRSWVGVRILAIGLSMGSVVMVSLLLAVLVVGPLLGLGTDLADELGLGGASRALWDWVRLPFAGVAFVAWAATLLHLAPFRRTPWRWDLPGAAFAAIVWIAVSVALRTYLEVASGSNQVFGSLGGALVVIVWLYLLAVGLLLGGELNALLAERYDVEARVPSERHAAWLRRLRAGLLPR